MMMPRTKSGTLRGCSIPAFTFYGGPGRAQILVYNHTNGSTCFCVNTLRAHYHPATAFKSRAGVCRYNGPDSAEALRVAQEYTDVREIPSGFKKFLCSPLIDVLYSEDDR